MRIVPIALFLLCATPSVAQFVSTPIDAKSCSLGGCLIEDDNRQYVTLSHRQGFAVSGLATQRLGLGWALGSRGWVSVDYIHFGDVDYPNTEQTFSIPFHRTNQTTWFLQYQTLHS